MVTEKKGWKEKEKECRDREGAWRKRGSVEKEKETGEREVVWRQSRGIAFWLRFSHDSFYNPKRIVQTTNLSTIQNIAEFVAEGRCNCVYHLVNVLFYVSSQQGDIRQLPAPHPPPPPTTTTKQTKKQKSTSKII